jgi:hypothetical protein
MGALDPGFDHLRRELLDGLHAVERSFADRLGTTEAALGQRIDALGQRVEATEAGLARLAQHVDASAAETRRHFDVVADSLRSVIATVAEGVVMLGDQAEEFRAEVRDNFARVDRRLLQLDARISTLERR